MTNFSRVITTFTLCKFIEEAVKAKTNVKNLFEQFSKECEYIGGDSEYFHKIAARELEACGLMEQEAAAPPANSVAAGGVAGMKPEDIGVSVEAQKRHTARNAIFRRRKPNKYYNDGSNKF